jgi:hypothetical protein
MIKTFRGVLADGGQDRIKLQTIQGKVGYRIVKFQVLSLTPGVVSQENVVKIYNQEQASVDGVVNFTDSQLLGVSYLSESASVNYPGTTTIIFDHEMFNQDIYVTHDDVDSNGPVNYYIELEAAPLSDQGAEYTTIRDLRANG